MSEPSCPGDVTLDEFNRHCFLTLSAAADIASLADHVRALSGHPLWNGRTARHACQMLVLLSDPRMVS